MSAAIFRSHADRAHGGPTRRCTAAAAAIVAAAALLAGCASSPPTRWYELRIDAPSGPPAGAPTAPAPTTTPPGAVAPAAPAVWELAPRIALPGALDRDTIVVADGDAGVEPLTGHRWAEPLRDAIPRVLLHDLRRLHGADRVFTAPAPAGVDVNRQLRVEVLALQADASRRAVRVVAQWWWSDARRAHVAPVRGAADFTVDIDDPASVDALAAAHRVALLRVAEQIAASPPSL